MDNPLNIICIFLSISSFIAFIIIAIKDRTKIGEMIFSFLLSALFFILPYVVDKQPVEESDSNTASQETQEVYNSTEYDSTATTTTTTTSTTTTTTTTTQPIIMNDNTINKRLSFDDETYTVVFTAPVTGTYRFDYKINDVNCDYYVSLIDSTNKNEFDSSYSTYRNGDTCKLIAGKEYSLIIKQKKGYPIATIQIGIPSPTAVLQFNELG